MRIFSTQKNTIETIVARKQSETKDVSTIVVFSSKEIRRCFN
jgi:histidinol dehydrogenase